MYSVVWWQLYPETEPRTWNGEDGEPECYSAYEDAAARRDELLADEQYRHLAFSVKEDRD